MNTPRFALSVVLAVLLIVVLLAVLVVLLVVILLAVIILVVVLVGHGALPPFKRMQFQYVHIQGQYTCKGKKWFCKQKISLLTLVRSDIWLVIRCPA